MKFELEDLLGRGQRKKRSYKFVDADGHEVEAGEIFWLWKCGHMPPECRSNFYGVAEIGGRGELELCFEELV